MRATTKFFYLAGISLLPLITAHRQHHNDVRSHESFNTSTSALRNAIGGSFLVSLISFSGAVLSLRLNQKFICFMSALAVGCLLGDPFLHLLPHIFEEGHKQQQEHGHHHGDNDNYHQHGTQGLWIIVGFMACLLSELCLRHVETDKAKKDDENKNTTKNDYKHKKNSHHHHHHHNHVKAFGWLNLASDAIHNFIDGIGIGAAFLTGWKEGVATTASIVFHEIPQELSDFGLLINAGFTAGRALSFNFLSGVFAVVGAAIGVYGGTLSAASHTAMLCLTAGSFIYIAAVDILPDLIHDVTVAGSSWKDQVTVVCGIACGVLVMYVLGIYEESIVNAFLTIL